VTSAIDRSVTSAIDRSVTSAIDRSVTSAIDRSVTSAIDRSVTSAIDRALQPFTGSRPVARRQVAKDLFYRIGKLRWAKLAYERHYL
jgi:hypothetical protein